MQALSKQLYDEFIWCKDMHFGGAITRAIMQKQYEDARKLKLQKTEPGYETSEALSDEVRPRLEHLQALLTSRFEELATAGEIDNCEICGQFMDIIENILNSTKL